jgi:hypothetical protein
VQPALPASVTATSPSTISSSTSTIEATTPAPAQPAGVNINTVALYSALTIKIGG